MLPSPSADLVENSMDYFYGSEKRQKTRVLLLETLEDCQFRDVLADLFTAQKPVPTIVIKTNKISELEQIRHKLLQLRHGSYIILPVRLDARFVTASVPGKIWHAFHQGPFLEVADPQAIVDAYRQKQARLSTASQISPAPIDPLLTTQELRQFRDLLSSQRELQTLVESQSAELAELKDRLARQEVRHQTTRMELEGDILQLRLEIGKLKGRKRRKVVQDKHL